MLGGSVSNSEGGINEELARAHAREAAMREILEVISQSREDDGKVFDVILRNAALLCKAPIASLMLVNAAGTHLVMAAMYGETLRAHVTGDSWPMDPQPGPVARSIRTARILHMNDLAMTDEYRSGLPTYVRLVDEDGLRTDLSVPLVREGVGFGAITLSRREVDPFDDADIALIETFAAQAVIAIENVRQFRELQTRLEREAATREILEVISQSRDDEKPVFDVLLRKAAHLCGAPMATLLIITDDGNYSVQAAQWGEHRTDVIPVGSVFPLDSPYAPETCMREGRIVHIHDLADTDLYLSGDPVRTLVVDKEGVRTLLSVPLVSDGRTIGCISTYRHDVRPFTPDEIALVETFSAQALIAIENVRQFRELQTRLEREAATRDILQVISQSREDDTPVFNMIAQCAARLCGAAMCLLWRVENGVVDFVASHGVDGALLEEAQASEREPLRDDTMTGQVVKARAVVQIEDATQESYHDHEWMRAAGLRLLIGVPIFVQDEVCGSINLAWGADRSPRDADIQLVESFAAQATIAIQNARQFRELQTRLEREAATRNILRVISESPDDEQPTFEAILDSATRLCGTPYASFVLGRRGDATQRMVAHRADIAETLALFREGKVPMDPQDSIAARAILEGRTIHVPDMADTDQYRAGHERFRLVVDRLGLRTNLFVPLLGPEGGIGCFILWKKEVAPFTADQIALMETFASHAVIAIENVRQFKALEALNAELGDRVKEQVGEIERMGRLKRFLPSAVADAVVSSGSEKLLSSHRALLGVLFCDIR